MGVFFTFQPSAFSALLWVLFLLPHLAAAEEFADDTAPEYLPVPSSSAGPKGKPEVNLLLVPGAFLGAKNFRGWEKSSHAESTFSSGLAPGVSGTVIKKMAKRMTIGLTYRGQLVSIARADNREITAPTHWLSELELNPSLLLGKKSLLGASARVNQILLHRPLDSSRLIFEKATGFDVGLKFKYLLFSEKTINLRGEAEAGLSLPRHSEGVSVGWGKYWKAIAELGAFFAAKEHWGFQLGYGQRSAASPSVEFSEAEWRAGVSYFTAF